MIETLKQSVSHMRNPDVSTWKKAAAIGAAGLYVLSPVDFVPDIVPGLGQLDDIAMIALISKTFNNAAEKDIAKAQASNAGNNFTSEQSVELTQDKDQDIFSRFEQMDTSKTLTPAHALEYEARR